MVRRYEETRKNLKSPICAHFQSLPTGQGSKRLLYAIDVLRIFLTKTLKPA